MWAQECQRAVLSSEIGEPRLTGQTAQTQAAGDSRELSDWCSKRRGAAFLSQAPEKSLHESEADPEEKKARDG